MSFRFFLFVSCLFIRAQNTLGSSLVSCTDLVTYNNNASLHVFEHDVCVNHVCRGFLLH